MFLVRPTATILPHLEYPIMLKNVCKAVALCYKAPEPKTQKECESFIRARVKMGHESVIEHVGFSVMFQVDRGITHEMVRHRLCSFTQESTRYCNYAKDKFGNEVTFIMPPHVQAVVPDDDVYYLSWQNVEDGKGNLFLTNSKIRNNPIPITDEAVKVWLVAMDAAQKAYMAAVTPEPKLMQPEIARGMLPNSVKAEITWTANMREWRHIFRLRALGQTGRPHPQMVEVMTPLLEEVFRRFPVFFEDL